MTPAERREAAQKRYIASCEAADQRYRAVVAAAERECNDRYEHAEAWLRDELAAIIESEVRDA